MDHLARIVGLTTGLLLASLVGAADAQTCDWSSRAYGSAPYRVVVDGDTVAYAQRLDTALPRAVREEAIDPRRRVDIIAMFRVECPIPPVADLDPPPASVPTFEFPTPDTIGKAVTLTMEDEGARVVMPDAGYTFVRWSVPVTPGVWRLVVRHDGEGGGVILGRDVFRFSEGATEDVFYRAVQESGRLDLEIDNIDGPMDRLIRAFRLEPASLSDAVEAVMVPAGVALDECGDGWRVRVNDRVGWVLGSNLSGGCCISQCG